MFDPVNDTPHPVLPVSETTTDPRLPEAHASIPSANNEQEASDVVESFFPAVARDEFSFAFHWSRIEALPGLRLDDASLPRELTSETVTALSSYDINRMFLHGLDVDVSEWTSSYRHNLQAVCQYVLSPVSHEDSPSLQALKRSYPANFLSNMLLISLFHEADLQLIAGYRPWGRALLFNSSFSSLMDRPRSPEQQSRLMVLIAPYFNVMVTNKWQFLNLLKHSPEQLSDAQRQQLLDAVQDKLSSWITDMDYLHWLLRLSPELLNSALRQQILDAIQGQLGELIPNVYDLHKLFRLSFGQLDATQRQQLWDAVKGRLDTLITNVNELRAALRFAAEMLDVTGRQQLWDAVKGRLGLLVTNWSELGLLLQLFSYELDETQREQIQDAIQDQLGAWTTTAPDLYRALVLVPEHRCQHVWNAIQGRESDLIKHSSDLCMLLSPERLSHSQRLQVLAAVPDQLTRWFPDVSEFCNVFWIHLELNEAERQTLWNAIQGHLGEWIKNARDLRRLLTMTPEQLNSAQRQDIYDACKEKRWAVAILEKHKLSPGVTARVSSCSSTMFAASSSDADKKPEAPDSPYCLSQIQ